MYKKLLIVAGSIFVVLLILAANTIVVGLGTGEGGPKRLERGNAQAEPVDPSLVFPDKVVVKFKQSRNWEVQGAATGIRSFDNLMKLHGVGSLEPVSKSRHVLSNSRISVGIDRIYYGHIAEGQSPITVARELSQDPNVEYAEPLYYHRLFDTPNDAQFGQQEYLNIIKATQAWDVVKGEQGSVVIAVVDGGTDIDHPDLAANLWVNDDEIPDNGIDDDNNGFVDDVNGWNFANDSNDPTGLPTTPINADHGSLTAGIVAAVTNNNLGIAGTSWNAKLMAINAGAPDRDSAIAIYLGLLYAAENVADIVNISAGRTGAASFFEQDLITMATEMGVLIVAAAGNDANQAAHYPSSYNDVLSVAATTNMDTRAFFSSFGTTVDISAPGENIRSTLNLGQYGEQSGTSFSAPIVAGVAALVKTQHPDWLPVQVSEQVRLTADNIDGLNPQLVGLLGKGRVNALRAVTLEVPAVRISKMAFNETSGDGAIQAGETVELLLTITNYLAPASNIMLTLTETGPSFSHLVTFQNATATIPSLANLEETAAPVSFTFDVSSSAPGGRGLFFALEITTSGNEDVQRFKLLVESQFVNTSINNIELSLTSFGRLGFGEPFDQAGGNGFRFNNGPSWLFEGAVMAAIGSSRISNAARGRKPNPNASHLLDLDFSVAEGGELQISTPGLLADEETATVFKDDKTTSSMNLRITQETFAMSDAPNDDFIIIRYSIENEGTQTLENFHFGLFLDWDLGPTSNDVFNNLANYDATRRLGYASFQSTFVGVSVLSDDDIFYNAIDNMSINDDNGWTDSEKWQAMSRGTQFSSAGPADVSQVIGSGPFTIEANELIQIDFALLAGTGFSDLQANADAARRLREALLLTSVSREPGPEIPVDFSLGQNYPNPFNPTTIIDYSLPREENVELIVFNFLGQTVRTLHGGEQPAGNHQVQWDGRDEQGQPVASGVFFYRIKMGDFVRTHKMILLR